MAARFRINPSWLGGIVAALALICLLGFDTSPAPMAQANATLTAQLVVAAESDHAHGAEHRGSGNEHHDKEGAKSSCCASAACSSPGMMSAMTSLFVIPVTISYRAVPHDRLIPFEQSPSERPPRAA
jgi:hypothetical protein